MHTGARYRLTFTEGQLAFGITLLRVMPVSKFC